MRISLGGMMLEADAEKTAAFYGSARRLTEGCSCADCRNFVKALDSLDPAITAFFRQLGTDPAKPAEMTAWCPEDDGRSVFYNGFYHLCGYMTAGEECWIPNGETVWRVAEEHLYPVTADFSVGFVRHIALREPGFPEPVLQMEVFWHHAPWVLAEPNSFL